MVQVKQRVGSHPVGQQHRCCRFTREKSRYVLGGHHRKAECVIQICDDTLVSGATLVAAVEGGACPGGASDPGNDRYS